MPHVSEVYAAEPDQDGHIVLLGRFGPCLVETDNLCWPVNVGDRTGVAAYNVRTLMDDAPRPVICLPPYGQPWHLPGWTAAYHG
jgi:hypothetical protein